MSHYAKIDDNNMVVEVIVAEQDFIDSGIVGDPSKWIQTSYNTRGGVHYAPNSDDPDGGIALRKNYAGIGFYYNSSLDAFIRPKPFPSWHYVESTGDWDSPVPWPDDGNPYIWDEENGKWAQVDEDNNIIA